ncbi:erythromycin esterase-like protein [Stackebrandtia endophytica]|uniref:Erythromycin esterase-like protein n=1 Tax=Stackebrandtia endophytica TaxID=1496996 RepID=A0A543B1P3_9ACTN|nr:erythromycin esterase family protein [Stackebrandtia endophytica]TQL78752.1 erythromycin esterase-like protein [Stackebrandtia endophytica]
MEYRATPSAISDLAAVPLERAFDDLLGRRPRRPLIALGEPTHGVAEFLRLRNDLVAHLVTRHDCRTITVESDCLAATLVDDYVTGGDQGFEAVMVAGFSHGFGHAAGNRELVSWLRDHNAAQPADRQVRFHGFDGPMELYSMPTPRTAITPVSTYLRDNGVQPPVSVEEVDRLLGDDADWTDAAALSDPTRSIGDSHRVRALRLAVDDLVTTLESRSPALLAASSETALHRARMRLRTAQWVLRYHVAAADHGPHRIAAMLGLRDALMAANLLDSAANAPGPALAFGHNSHLRRRESTWFFAGAQQRWWSGGAIAATTLGDRYLHIATDLAGGDFPPDTLHGLLGPVVTGGALFDAAH